MVTTLSASKSSHATEPKCPVCKSDLARTEYQAAMNELEKRISDKHLELSRKQKKEFDSALRELKVNHRRELQTLRKNLNNQQISQSKRLEIQSKKERQSFEKKIKEMKKNQQLALQGTREVYEKQNLMSQKEQEKAVNNQLKEIMQNYSGMASNYQKEIEKVRKMQEVHETVVRRKESEVARLKIELAKSNTDIQIRRLVVQLGERNAAIEQLQGRIRELESIMMGSSYSPQSQTNRNNNNNNLDSTFDERQQAARTAQSHQEEKENNEAGMSQKQRDLRDEFMTAIKEITREHKRAHEDNIDSNTNSKGQGTTASSDDSDDADSSMVEGKDLHSTNPSNPSKMNKMRSWFF